MVRGEETGGMWKRRIISPRREVGEEVEEAIMEMRKISHRREGVEGGEIMSKWRTTSSQREEMEGVEEGMR